MSDILEHVQGGGEVRSQRSKDLTPELSRWKSQRHSSLTLSFTFHESCLRSYSFRELFDIVEGNGPVHSVGVSSVVYGSIPGRETTLEVYISRKI